MLHLILALFWISGINAQYGGGQSSVVATASSSSTQPTSSSTQAAAKSVQSVDVGEDGFTFSPNTLTVSPGDKVEFHFYPGNHSVTQASFAKPCHPLSDASIFSGFVETTDGEADEVFTIVVNDTNPIWLYCAQIGHCQAGMVAVINPPGQDTLAAFKAAAAEVSSSSEPSAIQGGILGVPTNSSTSTSNGSTSTSSTSSTFLSSSISTTTTASTSSSKSTGSSSVNSVSSSTSNPSSTSTGSSSSSEAKGLQAWNDANIVLVLSVTVAFFLF